MGVLSWLFGKKKDKSVLAYYPDAVLVVSVSGEILYANQNLLDLFKLSSDKLFNMELFDLFDGGFNLIRNLSHSKDSAIVRYKQNLKDDLYFEIKASDYNEEEKIIISVRDVSHSQRMLNKLMFEHEYLNKLTKNKNTFLTKISGELTSPVHSINGFSQAILEGLGGDVNEKQEKYLKIINKNSTQLLDLINSIVEYSKLESGLYEYEFKNFDFVNLMTELFNKYKTIADDKKIILNFNLNSLGKRTFYSDENVLKKALEIILISMLEQTNSGSIQLSVSHPDAEYLEIAGFKVNPNLSDKTYALIKITSTGFNIPETELDSIFDPYANIDKYIVKKAVTKGMEMGVLYNLVRLMKGKIWAESEPSSGCTFSFIIPTERMSI